MPMQRIGERGCVIPVVGIEHRTQDRRDGLAIKIADNLPNRLFVLYVKKLLDARKQIRLALPNEPQEKRQAR
jgi:hypothetical protein